MEKISQIARQWAMLHHLSQNPDGVSIDDLSKELHVSSRTIQRDLSSMKDAGVSIDEEQKLASGKKFLSFVFPAEGKNIHLSY
ncbi:MAG: helix-turn-helix domain-containing protein, partial [Thermoguttaceae bacterium]|nr:helix-turn-helix domain-containing protein [Thermoguttaceae bacterium]